MFNDTRNYAGMHIFWHVNESYDTVWESKNRRKIETQHFNRTFNRKTNNKI